MTAVFIEPNVRALQERQEGSPPSVDLFYRQFFRLPVPISDIRRV